MAEPFVIHTYAGRKKYVPAIAGNREAWKAGKPFFWWEIEPMSAAEYEEIVRAAEGDEKKTADQLVIERRLKSIHDLVIQDKDDPSKKAEPADGVALYGEPQRMMDYFAFNAMRIEAVHSITKHSVLAEGELKVSDLPSG